MCCWRRPATAIAPCRSRCLKEEAGKLLLVDGEHCGRGFGEDACGRRPRPGNHRRPGVGVPAATEAGRGRHRGAHQERCATAAPNYPPIDVDKAVAWCQGKTGKELAPSQRVALRQALSTRALIITGRAGSRQDNAGQRHPAASCGQRRSGACSVRPTGRAAKRLSEATGVEAKTIHRLLEVSLPRAASPATKRRPLDCDLLVVDEVLDGGCDADEPPAPGAACVRQPAAGGRRGSVAFGRPGHGAAEHHRAAASCRLCA